MKLSVYDAADCVGISAQTLYRHIKSKSITTEQNDNGDTVIDASELSRIYGDKFKVTTEGQGSVITSNNMSPAPSTSRDINIQDVEELATLRAKVELMDSSHRRERELLEQQVENMQRALDKAQDGQNKLTLLLENKGQEGNKEDKWESTLKGLESRIVNQEATAQEEKERADKILRQNRALKKALDEEKNKSFFQKLFG